MRRIFLNADDFGLTNGVTRGIARAMLEGIVTTTSAMPCVPGSPERVSAALGPVNGRVGAHLQLTDGVPCCDPREIPSLVNGEGRFPRSWNDLAADRLNPDEIRKEWTAQIDRVLDWGIRPSHLDTHHHVHRFGTTISRLLRTGSELRPPGEDSGAPTYLRDPKTGAQEYAPTYVAPPGGSGI